MSGTNRPNSQSLMFATFSSKSSPNDLAINTLFDSKGSSWARL